jgi:hypothetical protein
VLEGMWLGRKDWRIGLGGFEWHGGAGVAGAGLWFCYDGACVTLSRLRRRREEI